METKETSAQVLFSQYVKMKYDKETAQETLKAIEQKEAKLKEVVIDALQ